MRTLTSFNFYQLYTIKLTLLFSIFMSSNGPSPSSFLVAQNSNPRPRTMSCLSLPLDQWINPTIFLYWDICIEQQHFAKTIILMKNKENSPWRKTTEKIDI